MTPEQQRNLEKKIRNRIDFSRGGYTPKEVYEMLMSLAKDYNRKIETTISTISALID